MENWVNADPPTHLNEVFHYIYFNPSLRGFLYVWIFKFWFYRGLDTYIKGWNKKFEAPCFLTRLLRIFWKFGNFVENRLKSQFCYLKKGVLELCRATTIKPRKIKHSGFFILDQKGQTWIYRLVWGPTEVWFLRNCNFGAQLLFRVAGSVGGRLRKKVR